MSTMCRNCDLPLNADDAFCANCGEAAPDQSTLVSVTDAATVSASDQAVAAVRPQQAETQVATEDGARPPRALSGAADSYTYGAGRPADGAAGYPSLPSPVLDRASSKGFFGSLFDFRFQSFVTPMIIRVVYVLIMIILGLVGLGFAVTAFVFNPILGIFVLVVVVPLVFFIELALYRIVLELFMVAFRIAEDLRAIRNRGGMS
jgi:hypothetical protein